MSFEGLQERLVALQETTTQIKELIDRLAELEFQPGSVPLGADEEDSVSGELSAEIGQLLRSGLEDQELLQEEIKYLRPDGHEKERLQDGVARVGRELSRYVLPLVRLRNFGELTLSCVLSAVLVWHFEKRGLRRRSASRKHRNSNGSSSSNHTLHR